MVSEAEGSTVANDLLDCMLSVMKWMSKKAIKLNRDKTELFCFDRLTPTQCLNWWPSRLGKPPIPVLVEKNLGVIINVEVTLDKQVNAVSAACFVHLRAL